MKKLGFIYKMYLEFDTTIVQHNFSLRCLPSNNSKQRIFSLDYNIKPIEHITKRIDCFGNKIIIGDCMKSHNSFAFEVSGIAWVNNYNNKAEELDPIYKYPSQYTTVNEDMIEFYNNMLFEGSNLQRAIFLMNGLFNYFKYVPCSTNIKTIASEAFVLGEGVCQDYSHILISLCRLGGIPARYVVGLMCGEGVTHAWVEIYDDKHWVGLDPTNNKIVDDYYIKLSHGRDFNDCIIDNGVFTGNAKQNQKVYVSVKEII